MRLAPTPSSAPARWWIRDVPAYALMAGVPARRIGWMSRAGVRLGDDLVCPLDGSRYRLDERGLLEHVS